MGSFEGRVGRQTPGQRIPLVPTRAAAINAQFPLGRLVLRITFDGEDVNGLRLVGMDGDGETEV